MPLHNMTPAELKTALDADDILLIDVREPHEFEAESIQGAVNYPLSTFDPGTLPSEDGKYLVLSCAGGVRSVRAAEACVAAGLEVDHHLAGGINAWKAAGLPTIR